MTAVRNALRAYASALPVKEFRGADGDVYMRRYKVFKSSAERAELSIYLHQILRPDEDIEYHNHPWEWGYAFILYGGYVEHRQIRSQLEERVHVPEDVVQLGRNVRLGREFHRVHALLKGESWSVCIVGPKMRNWGFKHPDTRIFTPHAEFFAKKYGIPNGQS